MRWYACYITLNGEEYIWNSIKSIYNFIARSGGKIIIIEGSTEYARMTNDKGNSIDNTHGIIHGFIKDDPRVIIYKQLGKVKNKAVLRNAYMEEMRKQPSHLQPEWVLVMDDDELYHEKDLKQLDYHLSSDSNLVYIFNPQFWFWKDFNHLCVADEVECRNQIKSRKRKDKLFKDVLERSIRQGEYHERIFKWNTGLHYINHATISDWRNYDVYIHPMYQTKRLIYPGCPRYHYGYLTTTKRMAERCQYYERRDKGRNLSKEQAEEFVWNDNYGHYLLTGSPKNKLNSIVPFTGTHPSAIAPHAYYKKGLSPIAEDAARKTNNE